MQAGFYDENMEQDDEEMKDIKKVAKKIRTTRKLNILESRFNKAHKRKSITPRTAQKVPRSRLERTMEDLGLDMSNKDDAHYNKSVARSESHVPVKRAREDAEGNVRSSSRMPRDKSGVRDASMAAVARTMKEKSQRKFNKKDQKRGEGDHAIITKKPKHLFSGKRKMGKTDRR